MAARGSGVTLSRHAYEQIRGDILGGRHQPDQPLRLAALAADLEMSMSVIREALTRLAEQGLVIASPNQGFRVVPLSEDDLADLTEMRVLLECTALRRSTERGDVWWEGHVVSAHHILERAPDPGTADAAGRKQWTAAHATFHEALSAGCGSPRLLTAVQSLRDGAEIYRIWSADAGEAAGRDIAGEHRRLKDLATARDADRAVAALRAHLETTTRLALAGLAAPAAVPVGQVGNETHEPSTAPARRRAGRSGR